MISSDPRLKSMMEKNPEMKKMFSNPETMKEMMEMMTNPEYQKHMQNSVNRALINLNAVPGGFDALKHVYAMQKPLFEDLSVPNIKLLHPPPPKDPQIFLVKKVYQIHGRQQILLLLPRRTSMVTIRMIL